MNSLNQIEIQNIRHLVGNMSGICAKSIYYKTLTQDQNLSKKYDGICTVCTSLKNKLTSLLKEV